MTSTEFHGPAPYTTNRRALEPCPCCFVPAFTPCLGHYVCVFEVTIATPLTEAEEDYVDRFYRYTHKPVLSVGIC